MTQDQAGASRATPSWRAVGGAQLVWRAVGAAAQHKRRAAGHLADPRLEFVMLRRADAELRARRAVGAFVVIAASYFEDDMVYKRIFRLSKSTH